MSEYEIKNRKYYRLYSKVVRECGEAAAIMLGYLMDKEECLESVNKLDRTGYFFWTQERI
jgi:hypothetical protein